MSGRKTRKKLILVAMLLIAALLFTACSSPQKISEDAVAVVNGTNIPMEEFEKLLALQRIEYEMMYGPDILTQDLGTGMTLLDTIKKGVLENLVKSEILLQEAMKNNITVEDEDIEEAYNSYVEHMEGNEDLKVFTEENNIDEAFVRKEMKKNLIIHRYRDFYFENLEIDEAAAEAYYGDNPLEFVSKVSAKHILVLAATEDAEGKAEELLSKINNEEEFSALFEQYVEAAAGDEIIAEELGYFGRQQMVPEFEAAAFSLNPGEISDIVQTSFGYHIILVEDKETYSFEEMKDYIIQFLKQKDFEIHIGELEEKSNITKREEL
ncbi:peptidylprolyl isomerase [Natronincola ferrireducens]|uniref:Foldase protein PrsA n=1 Tax=Natronincola ferrireducens TaxID=393762 RepID=A0A1G8WYP2_9FIRM|nr:peptidylprolyl isomerase [Natronincola ferrireducens]SDJ83324.1 foldase protein PrsA [Natronincola ferrireducens]